MKRGKRIVSFILVMALLITTCFTNGFGAFATDGTTENTSVTGLDIANNAFRFTLSATDFTDGSTVYNEMSASAYKDYNYWTNIKIYVNGEEAPVTLEYANTYGGYNATNNPQYGSTFYNLFQAPNTYAVGSATAIHGNAVKVVIPAGTEFPSYQYTSGKSTTKKCYVTTENVVFVRNGDSWTKTATENTSVTGIDIVNDSFRFNLSVTDFTDGSIVYNETSASAFTDYNYWTNIQIYLNGESAPVTLEYANADTSTSNPQKGNTFYNLFQASNTFAVGSATGIHGNAVKVVIPAGTEFPSYQYTSGKSTTKKCYVTTEDITYAKNSSGVWEVYVEPPTEDTSVTGIDFANQALRFRLSNNDYGNATTGVPNDSSATSYTDYNYWSNVLIYTNDTTYKTLQTAYDNRANAGNTTFYNLWTDWGTYAVSLDQDSLDNAVKVVIPAGTEFPSYRYTSGALATKKSYVTTEDITYVKNGSAWEVYVGPSTVNTSVTGMDVANDTFRFTLSVTDFTDGSTLYNDLSASAFKDYNYWTNIKVYMDGETSPVTLEYANADASTNNPQKGNTFYNLFQASNTFAVGSAVGIHQKAVKVVIPAGTEFPSYQYTSGAVSAKRSFVTTEDITYVKNSSGMWDVYYEPIVNKTTINKIHIRNGKLLVFLSSHDYADVGATTSIGDKLEDYNVLDKIVLSTGSETKKLADIATTERYYNVWGEIGSVSFGLEEGWNGTTITEVAINSGCEFPAYNYTSGATNAKTSYVVETDYLYKTGSSQDANTDWSKVEVRTIKTTVSAIQNAHNGHHITFTLDKSDYHVGANTPVGEKHTDYNYWNNVQIYSNDATYTTMSDSYLKNGQKYYNMWENWNSISIELSEAIDNAAVRIVIPAGTIFPCSDYTNGSQIALSGYEITHETIYEKIDGVWKDVSREESKATADANGDGSVTSKDIICMKKYLKNGYGVNETADCNVDGDIDIVDLGILREVLLGRVLHNYQKESSNLLHFSSSDMELDHFLNDYFKRQVGYVDYEEGDMSVTSTKPGKAYVGIFNQMWNTKALSWFNSADSLESDRTASIKAQLEAIPVDRYGYVWDGMDVPEDPTNYIGESHSMGWPFPNATHTDAAVRFWEFNDSTDEDDSAEETIWSTNLLEASVGDGLYKGVAETNSSSVTFEVKDDGLYPIIDTKYAPWLAIDLRMYNVVNPENIDDIYVSYATSIFGSYVKTIKAGDIAALTYNFGETYEHTLYLPMYTQSDWNNNDIYKLKIEIKAKSGTTFSGDIALNYVRPSFDTRCSNNNSNYISSLKEYYAMTGDLEFLQNNITKARKAMNFYLQMYDEEMQLNDQSYLYGHGGSKTDLAEGVGNGYWDVLYTPKYDLQSNLYFYRALEDMVYLENVLTKNDIFVDSLSAQVMIAPTGVTGTPTSAYSKTVDDLISIALAVKTKMQTYFWNADTGRFMAGYEDSTNTKKVDYGYTMWNLEAVELGIATAEQERSIMDWINGDRSVSSDKSTGNDIYKYAFAPRCNTVDDVGDESKISGIYGALIQNGHNQDIARQKFGECVQFGGSIMYTSYYDLMSRIDVKGADNAFTRLKGIQDWYDGVYSYYTANNIAKDEFYLQYYRKQGITPQNGSKGYRNGAVGVDGEFTESLLTLAAIPYGFFGMDTDDGKNLKVAPSLPSELDHWKVENMSFNGVTYDLSIFEDAVRIDSVRGETTGLGLTVTLDYEDGEKVYVNGTETMATIAGGKATVTIPFGEAIVEVR